MTEDKGKPRQAEQSPDDDREQDDAQDLRSSVDTAERSSSTWRPWSLPPKHSRNVADFLG